MGHYFEINRGGHNIRCKLYANSIPHIRRMVLFCHGFAGHKDNSFCQKFSEKLISKYKDTAVLIFNWPCHGDDVKKKLTLEDCGTYLDIVVAYIREQYNPQYFYAYATSFGGYLLLKYLQEKGNPFRKIVLRCPAVNMHDVLKDTIMKGDEFQRLSKGKPVSVGFDRKIEITARFLESLQEADIQLLDYLDFAEDIRIIHGTADEVVPYAAAFRFAERNLIELIPVKGADHRFQNPRHTDEALKATLSFFNM